MPWKIDVIKFCFFLNMAQWITVKRLELTVIENHLLREKNLIIECTFFFLITLFPHIPPPFPVLFPVFVMDIN